MEREYGLDPGNGGRTPRPKQSSTGPKRTRWQRERDKAFLMKWRATGHTQWEMVNKLKEMTEPEGYVISFEQVCRDCKSIEVEWKKTQHVHADYWRNVLIHRLFWEYEEARQAYELSKQDEVEETQKKVENLESIRDKEDGKRKPKATSGRTEVSRRTKHRLPAAVYLERMASINERLAKLTGADMPAQTEVTVQETRKSAKKHAPKIMPYQDAIGVAFELAGLAAPGSEADSGEGEV